MKVVTKTITSENQNNKKKHLVYFFGLGESIKSNNDNNNFGQWVYNKNIDIHLFDYHYEELSYPEHFHNTKFKLKRGLITIIVASIIGFTGYSIIASKMSISLKVPTFTIFLIPVLITSVIVGIFYKEATAYLKFITKGKDPIRAGTAIVIDLLEKGVHPNDIILMGNSLDGGIAAEVLKKFEEENVHFTLIHSNSYDSWKNVPRSQKSFISTLFKRISIIVDIWFKLCHLNYKPNEIIKSTKSPVLATNRIGDPVIDEAAQSVPNLQKSKDNFEKDDGFKVLAMLSINRCKAIARFRADYNIDSRVSDEKIWSVIGDNPHIIPLAAMDVNNNSVQREVSYDENETYEELLENFTDETHEPLKELNKDFNLNDFKQKKLYQKTKKDKVSLIDIDNPSSKVEDISYSKQAEKKIA